MKPSHETKIRPEICELVQNYKVDNRSHLISKISENTILIINDVLTTGRHFKAMQQVICDAYSVPKNQIIGIFLARRIFKTEER